MRGRETEEAEEGTGVRGRGLLILALAALLVGGCGGGRDPETTAATSAPAQSTSTIQGQGQGEEEAGEGQSAKASPRTPPALNPPIAQERTPGSKAVAPEVPIAEGGDNSIQAFGLEGDEDQAEQAAQMLGDYLDARARGDWAAACEAASAELERQLEELFERAKAKEAAQKPQGCAAILELVFGSSPKAALKAVQIEEVLSFRIRDDGYAYLIFKSEGAAKFIAMANDEGVWKVNTLEPTSFPQTEEQGSDQ